jgi:hypothetical protein
LGASNRVGTARPGPDPLMLGTVVPTRNFCEKAIAMRIAQVSPSI